MTNKDDTELREKGQALLDAAYAYWEACRRFGQYGAIQWIDDITGRTVIFTRGEYRTALLNNVDQLRFEGAKLHTFNLDTAPQHGITEAEDSDLSISMSDDRKKLYD